MAMTREEIEELMRDSDEEVSTNNDVLEDEDERYIDIKVLVSFAKIFGLRFLAPLVETKRQSLFIDDAELDSMIWMGDNLSDNLDEYQNMTTKYLKHFKISNNGEITPLVIHYQSNFPSEVFNIARLDIVFREVFQDIRFKFQNLFIASKIEEGYVASSSSAPLLCRTYNFFGANDRRGQILIGVPYDEFLKWKKTAYLTQDEIDELSK